METKRVFDILNYQKLKHPQDKALVKKEQGKWLPYSTSDIISYADKISQGLLRHGIKKGDKIAIIAYNRPEWNFADFGIQQIGAISIPMYPTSTIADFKYIFEETEIKIIFVSNQELYAKAREAAKDLALQPKIFCFDKTPDAEHWSSLCTEDTENPLTLSTLKESIRPEDLLTIIYTSGTTGNPKGVMLTHDNMFTNFKACSLLMPVNHGDSALSFLPLCHAFERMMNYLYIYCGVSVYYAESMDTIGENLKEVKPHIFATAPRLLEKVYEKIYKKGSELKGIKKNLFGWSLSLGLQYELPAPKGWWYNLQLKIAGKLIFSKWREALGGNVKAIVSGSAPLQPRLARLFWAAGVPIMEGYGLTETSPGIAVGRLDGKENRIGTVGMPIAGVEIKIAEDGEILTRGPHIMKGYYKKEHLTAEVINHEGWLHTGDIGRLVENKFLMITDRKKEIFKTSGGKYISPQTIENKFKESPLFEQVVVVGEGRKFPSALIVPNFIILKEWCQEQNIPYSKDEEIVNNEYVQYRFSEEIKTINNHFAQFEKIKKYKLICKPWSIDSGELTPTLKVKRKVILQNFLLEIEEMYSE